MKRTTPTAAASAPDFGILMPITVYLDDLDLMGILHNSRYQVLVERAWSAFWMGQGFGGKTGLEGDGFQVIKAFTITYEAPLTQPGECAVHLWMEHMGNTSATAGYRVCSADGDTTYAQGTRTFVRLDSTTLLPTPWSDRGREVARTIGVPQDRK
ncbi:acyl-CoA thioesterase [Streptomyces sp. NPDC020362]|uniref:acyl-CoA thioesterase n=1 Tax=unclassified Streptomyces TaxID=2593676 RepID=UPI0033D1EC5A